MKPATMIHYCRAKIPARFNTPEHDCGFRATASGYCRKHDPRFRALKLKVRIQRLIDELTKAKDELAALKI